MNVPPSDLLKSLRSELCPACGRDKKALRTFCGGCYHQLPRPIAKDLYKRFKSGYEEAVGVALQTLGVREFKLRKPAP